MVGKLKQSKVVNKAKAIKVTKAAVPEQIVAPVVVEDEDQDVSSDDDDEEDEMDGVTEEGMEKLMALLGEEGISDFDRAQLEEMEDNEDDEDDEEDEEDEEVDEDGLPLDDESDDDEEMDDEEEIEEEDQVEGEEQDIALDDLESDLSVDEDAVPVRKVTINNRTAMRFLREQLEITKAPWPEHLTLTSHENHAEVDAGDDLKRELAFYKQAISIVAQARKLCVKHDVPFTRPKDYYAEMVKSDSHMERVRTKLVDEASSIKKSEAAKKQRDLKKYGKQIQHEKLKSRLADKKGLDDRLRGIKRKRKDGMELGEGGDDDFDVALDDAIEGKGGNSAGRGGRGGRGGRDGPKMPRHARDAKFSMGGGGRRSKQNTKESSNDFDGFRGSGGGGRGGGGRGGARGGRGGARGGRGGGGGGRGGGGGQRPGKSRREAGRT